MSLYRNLSIRLQFEQHPIPYLKENDAHPLETSYEFVPCTDFHVATPLFCVSELTIHPDKPHPRVAQITLNGRWGTTIDSFKRGHADCKLVRSVVPIFCERQILNPVLRKITHEAQQICLKNTICNLSLTIRLWMVWATESKSSATNTKYFAPKMA